MLVNLKVIKLEKAGIEGEDMGICDRGIGGCGMIDEGSAIEEVDRCYPFLALDTILR